MWRLETSISGDDLMASTAPAGSELGAAVIVSLLAMALIMALGLALALTTGTETAVASNVRLDIEAGYAAEAGLELALLDLAMAADWTAPLGGLARSSFVDGPPGGLRVLADGHDLDLDALTGTLNCGRPACTVSQMDASTAGRPWGPNNPRWQLFAHGPLAALVGDAGSPPDTTMYLAVWIADDPMENDGRPDVDGPAGSPGTGVLLVRAEAFGPRQSRRAVQATVRRAPQSGGSGLAAIRIVSWREVS
jgi:hypothetical protein